MTDYEEIEKRVYSELRALEPRLTKQISFRIDDETYERMERYINQSDYYESISHLVRGAVDVYLNMHKAK